MRTERNHLLLCVSISLLAIAICLTHVRINMADGNKDKKWHIRTWKDSAEPYLIVDSPMENAPYMHKRIQVKTKKGWYIFEPDGDQMKLAGIRRKSK